MSSAWKEVRGGSLVAAREVFQAEGIGGAKALAESAAVSGRESRMAGG